MFSLLLIRPGTTDYDEQGRIKGRLSIPLNDAGRGQMENVVAELAGRQVDAIYAAPCQAAQETATALSTALGVRQKSTDVLQNPDAGLWQGRLIDEIRIKNPKTYRRWQERPETMCPPEGEMLADVQQRLNEFMERLGKKTKPGSTVAIVVAEPLASILCALLKQEELGDLWRAETQSGGWEQIHVDRQKLVAR